MAIACVPARELECSLHRFGTAVAKEHAVNDAATIDELFGQIGCRCVVIQVRQMQEAARMLGNRCGYIGVAIAERIDGDACHTVEIALPGGVIQVTTLAAFEHKIRAGIGLQDILAICVDNGIGHRVLLWYL